MGGGKDKGHSETQRRGRNLDEDPTATENTNTHEDGSEDATELAGEKAVPITVREVLKDISTEMQALRSDITHFQTSKVISR